MPTLLLTRQEVQTLLVPAALLPDMRSAFKAYSLKRSVPAQRARSPLWEETSATVLFPGLTAGIPAYTLKVHAKLPGQQPAIQGLIHLHDLSTGELLAVIESSHLTAPCVPP